MTTHDHQLSLGENRAFPICSGEKFSRHRLIVAPGEKYHFAVSSTDLWFDMGWPTNANGFNNLILKLTGKKPRLEKEKCFALCAALNKNLPTAFVIGTELSKTFTETGVLSFFANDADGWYFNNWGRITLEVLRLT